MGVKKLWSEGAGGPLLNIKRNRGRHRRLYNRHMYDSIGKNYDSYKFYAAALAEDMVFGPDVYDIVYVGDFEC